MSYLGRRFKLWTQKEWGTYVKKKKKNLSSLYGGNSSKGAWCDCQRNYKARKRIGPKIKPEKESEKVGKGEKPMAEMEKKKKMMI